MRRAFIVRPFSTKQGVDFDRVERELIAPALDGLGIHGRTTGEILQQGNIRSDMFQRLLTADLVVADVSIHNANVFYELGIRHALQDKFTVLIRCPLEGVKTPFDIGPDRYMEYAHQEPGKKVAELAKRIRATLDGDQADSPVFGFLPGLRPQDRERFILPPDEFVEEVARARHEGRAGDLDTYAAELRELDIPWALGGLLVVGEAQFKMKSWEAARDTWEAIRETCHDHQRANQRLATIYQKQPKPDLVRSEQAVERALGDPDVSPYDRAELLALRGSNAKTEWIRGWCEEDDLEARQGKALASASLLDSLDAYRKGYSGYLNHYYSGLNALAMKTILVRLAEACPDDWKDNYGSDEEAERELERHRKEQERLAAAVEVSIQAARAEDDPWVESSEADYQCLVSSRTKFVKRRYEQSLDGANHQQLDSVRRQLEILKQLDVCRENAEVALEAVGERLAKTAAPPEEPARVIVFSGHRLDAPGRKEPRFPATAEPAARELILQAVKREVDKVDGPVIGYAGGASGGDILFHEVCEELGIPTWLLLAAPRDAYVVASVQDAGPQWVERFDAILAAHANRKRELSDDSVLPRWLRSVENFSIWEHNNIWMLHNALAHGGSRVVLLALWNHLEGDGPGGTKQMVEEAKKRGARTEILDARPFKDL